MAWQTPKTNWGAADVPLSDDFNRIEGNVQELQNTKETPAGAQAKAEAAAGAVQAELNTHKADNAAHVPHLGTTTNSGNNYSITSTKVVNDGSKFSVKFNTAATGTATLKISSDGTARTLKKPGGGDFKPKAGIYTLIRDGVNFQLLGEGGEYGTAQANHVLSPYTIGTDSGLITGTMPNHGSKTFTPSDSTQTGGAGYYSGITVNPRPTLSGNATADQVLAGRTFYNNSYTKRTGTLVIPIPYTSVWTQRTSSFGSTFIQDVAYGNNMFVAVGYNGKLATSTDGITWTQRTSNFGTGNYIYSVTYGNNMFVAGGTSGKLATSTNGITWTQRTSSFDYTIYDITYSNNMFVAVGYAGELATSTDGITWTQRDSSFGNYTIYGITHGVVNGSSMFVAGGGSGKLATLS